MGDKWSLDDTGYNDGCKDGYNQALEDFSKKMKEINLTNSFVLYYSDEIDLEEFMNLASDEILEQLKK